MVAKKSLRDTAQAGTTPLPKLSDYDGEMLVIDCSTMEFKAFVSEFGESTNPCGMVLVIHPDKSYTALPNTAIFAQAIAKDVEICWANLTADPDGNRYVVGRLGKRGRSWLLDEPEDAAEWSAIESAVAAYEKAF